MIRRATRFNISKRWLWSLWVAGFILFSAALSYSADVNEISTAIQSKGARWVAKETPLSHLSREEMKRKVGGLLEPELYPGAPSPGSSSVPLDLELPTSFDWADYDGGSYVTSIKDQGECGGCWAFSSVAALESKTLITFNMPGIDLDLSEQILISCSDAGNCLTGGYLTKAADFLKNAGTSLESCYPYEESDGYCAQACSDWETNNYRIDSWRQITKGSAVDLTAIKSALIESGPLPAWMKVYEDFFSYGQGIYSYTYGQLAPGGGGHYVLIVGWDDSKEALHVKNSWGTGWGEEGFFWIAYEELYGAITSYTLFGQNVYVFGDAVHIPVTVGPDLTGQWLPPIVKTCKTSSKGQKCKISGSFQVSNTGNRDASSFYVDIIYSGALVKQIRVPKLKANANKVLKISVNLPPGTDQYIRAAIDPEDAVAETDKTNNIQDHPLQ
jgi:C1A family cysteine protease